MSFDEMHPDDMEAGYAFYRPQSAQIFRQLPYVKPNALYIFGSRSPVSTPEARKVKVEPTGSGAGSGWKQAKEVVVDGGHLVPFNNVEGVGEAVVGFVKEESESWEREEGGFEQRWYSREREKRVKINDVWKEKIRLPPSRGKVKEKL